MIYSLMNGQAASNFLNSYEKQLQKLTIFPFGYRDIGIKYHTLQEGVTGSHSIFFNFDNGGWELATPNTSITFTVTVPGGDSRGFMGVEGIKDGVNFGSFYYDNDTVETYTRTITASADYDALNFWFRHGDWTVLGDMSITIKLN